LTRKSPDVSIIIVSYNTRAMTLKAIETVKAETRAAHEIIVVDNGSSDGSADAIAEAHPDVDLIAETTNHGFGPAHEVAAEHASAPKLLLLNSDTEVLEGALDQLLEFSRRYPSAGIWGGRTLYADHSLNPTSCFAKMTLWSIICRILGLNGIFRKSKLFNSEFYGDWQRDTESFVDIVTGCLLLVDRSLWDELEGFDRAFAMYGEEVDFCLRAKAVGAKPMITPKATIIHHGGGSQTVRADKLVRLLRAKTELIVRHFPARSRLVALTLFRLWPLSRSVAYSVGAYLKRDTQLRVDGGNWREVWQRRREWKDGFRQS